MTHPAYIELIEYVAGNADESDRSVIEAHLSRCRRCTALVEEVKQTWESLGRWEVDTSGRDISMSVFPGLAAADRPTKLITPARKPDFSRFFAAAASVVVAAILGYMAGSLSASGSFSSNHIEVRPPKHFAAFGRAWSEGLIQLTLQADAALEAEK